MFLSAMKLGAIKLSFSTLDNKLHRHAVATTKTTTTTAAQTTTTTTRADVRMVVFFFGLDNQLVTRCNMQANAIGETSSEGVLAQFKVQPCPIDAAASGKLSFRGSL